MATQETRSIARRYFDAWTSKNAAAVREALAPDYEFTAGELQIKGRDAFLAGASFPPNATVKMVAEAYDGDTAFQMYDATNGGRTARIVEQLTVRDGAIASSTIVTDQAAFGAFMQG
jgi:ketosteroid isomerase-like protein